LTLLVGPRLGLPDDNRMLAAALALAAGFLGPNQFLSMRTRRRQRQIRRALPNALDLMVVCVESGLGLDQAIMQTAKELRRAHPEISQEFAQVNFELKAGKRRVEALRNLAERCSVDELKKLVAVLVQADRFGTGIAQTLRSHSDYMRVQARQVAEEKASKLGVKLVFPIFFCILPSLFVVTVGSGRLKVGKGGRYATGNDSSDLRASGHSTDSADRPAPAQAARVGRRPKPQNRVPAARGGRPLLGIASPPGVKIVPILKAEAATHRGSRRCRCPRRKRPKRPRARAHRARGHRESPRRHP
jgi:tight adherence protein C